MVLRRPAATCLPTYARATGYSPGFGRGGWRGLVLSGVFALSTFSLSALAEERAVLVESNGTGSKEEPPPPTLQVDLRRVHHTKRGSTAPIVSRGGGTALLTLDPDLQEAARRLLVGAHPHQGAVVVVDLQTGRLLVLAEALRRGGRSGSALFDTQAPSASLFKLVTTAALFDHTRVRPGTRVCVAGGKRRIERKHLEVPDPREEGVTCRPFFEALGHSRNAAYAQLTTRFLLRGDLSDMAEAFGLGRRARLSGFDAPTGTLDLPFGDLDLAQAAAGFIGSRLTPLGALSVVSSIAAGGRPLELQVIDSAPGYQAPLRRVLGAPMLKPRSALNLVRMMEVTVHGGTSLEAFTDPRGVSFLGKLRIAGKTGTLQPSKGKPTTTWFAGFAPARKPRVAIAVLLQNGSVWKRKANEVARDVLRAYFSAEGVPGITDPFESEASDSSHARPSSREKSDKPKSLSRAKRPGARLLPKGSPKSLAKAKRPVSDSH